MAFQLTGNFGLDFIITLATLLGCVIAYYRWSFTYWKRKGIYNAAPSIPFGNAAPLFTNQLFIGDLITEQYHKIKSKGLKHGGMYFLAGPVYIPIDPDIIKNILQTDFSHFTDRGMYVNEELDPLSGQLFNAEGLKWRNLRVKLTPAFTSGRMKMMFPILLDRLHGLHDLIDDAISKKQPLDVKDILGRFTTDVTGSCAFGIECNSLKEPNSVFRKYGKLHFEMDTATNIKTALQFALPHSLLRMVRLRLTRTDVEKFFFDIVKSTIEYREKNNISRKDFMHQLLQMKDSSGQQTSKLSHDGNNLTVDDVVAQAFGLYIGGFETAATTFALYEVAKNQEIQDRLRQEINSVLEKHNNNQVTYEAILEMVYLDKVIKESMRKYPAFPIIPRKCTKRYTVPGTSLTLEEGTIVIIPMLGLHTDPEHFPNPERFDPSRFDDDVKTTRHPYAYLPFGEGPRICIGMKYGYLQAKVAVATIIKNYKVTVNSKTKEPISFATKTLITATKGGMWLDAEKIKTEKRAIIRDISN